MALKREIAEMIARDISLGLCEGTCHCFEKNPDFPEEAKEYRYFYLRLSQNIINLVKKRL